MNFYNIFRRVGRKAPPDCPALDPIPGNETAANRVVLDFYNAFPNFTDGSGKAIAGKTRGKVNIARHVH